MESFNCYHSIVWKYAFVHNTATTSSNFFSKFMRCLHYLCICKPFESGSNC
ncbi:hypothetical protein HanRHA438_Chr15g0709091 [Helianthus annuus]|nr:hypothetical protein HanIR_Chr15g0757351 [Helianthus annuus]KAJ0845036.1 hypothetical protein HanRHA438_Chr15g0709091 [Helianthus annuus]